ncbi:MAG: NAD-dependent epimerase/dehydratase [Candidatus Marinimicrobia bacterium]|nr:NAD-dependent epimerase/dehydratase [Candidatus Neomarinimicrobiota bacterium]|tara:strand:- start:1837 stop:2784 length:948 start_codon:yes stop_codon:yes gene_type:complete
MKILVTGGCGYKGSLLIPKLLDDGHKVINVDTQWFGNYIGNNPNLKNLKQDIRDIDIKTLENVDTVIHLANIANDPAVTLNPSLSWEVNVLASQQLADNAVRAGVKKIIYASSGSVYGIKDEPSVTEDLELVPISVYNKTKMVAERVFLSYKENIKIFCIRPATVCGISPRMRLDVAVNLLTYQALKNKKIVVLGGEQTRPNIHIKDMVKVYCHFLEDNDIESGCYNAGFENISILEIAKKVQKYIEAEIIIKESNDPRSYRQDSNKLLKTGFKPLYNIEDAIKDIKAAFDNNLLRDDESCYTVKWMKKLNLNEA